MRIALITRRFPPMIGGAEKVLSYLAPALVAQAAEVTVLTSQLDDSPSQDEIDGARIIRLPTSSLRFVGTWLYMRNLKRYLMSHKFEFIYVSMMKHDAYVAVDIGKRLGIPVILRPEGAGTTGDIAWQSWGRGGAAIARRAKQADAFVAISTGVHQELINAGYPPEKIVDLPNGVPIPSLSWLERAEFKTTPTAMFVGRLAEEKGLTCLIDAWPFVRERFPQAQLKLVGEGPMRERLTAHIQTLSLESHIQLLGAQQDPNGLLKKADLFVLPSREEGMSIALLEAMALAIPLVASDISGNRKLVTDGVEGKLVPPDNPERLAQAIVSQWSDFPSAVRQGFAARERVSQRFSIDAMARAHLVLFRDLTGG